MTIAKGARLLHLDLPQEKEGNEFGVELPDEIDSQLMDQTLTPEMLANGNRLMDMNMCKEALEIRRRLATADAQLYEPFVANTLTQTFQE